jgi:hypothetical protein
MVQVAAVAEQVIVPTHLWAAMAVQVPQVLFISWSFSDV